MSTVAIAERRPTLRSPSPHGELDLLSAGTILPAVAAAERLRRSALDDGVERSLLNVLDTGDTLARMLSLRALSLATGRDADRALVEALDERDLAEHAAWALVGRTPLPAAIPALVRLVAVGGFAAMPAQLALQRWGDRSRNLVGPGIRHALAGCSTEGGRSRLVETLALANEPVRPLRAAHRRRADAGRGGLRVAQILLRGRVDAELAAAGSGDGGGVVTLLVQLARELGRLDDVETSLIVARPRDAGSRGDEPLGQDAGIVRLPFGPSERVPVGEMWEYRAQVERALLETITASGPIDVAHLRYADAGTFAAARALRRAGVRIVFTLAPDPHALIAEGARGGTLTRNSFARAESVEHNLFRLRLIDHLVAHADQVVTLPRAGGDAELERLISRRLPSGRTTSVPEGVATAPIEQALDAVSGGAAELPAVAAQLRSALARLGEDRLGLPLILSAGRFHPVKGFPRLVEAWAGDPALADRFNLVIVGGDLERPGLDEQAVIAEIEAVAARHPAVRSGLVLLGARPHEDVAHLLAITRHGLPGAAAPAGLYACASAKEEFGVALLEALASGLPVVAPAGGGPDSYLEHGATGILVEPGRVDTLRTGLRRATLLTGDEQRAARAAALVRDRFAIGPVAAALAGTYLRAAGTQ